MDKNSLTHKKWECMYHIVFAPKHLWKVIHGKIKVGFEIILNGLGKRKGVEIIESKCCLSHTHILLRIPPKFIRDTGREIHFSGDDPVAKKLATKFAGLKWGRNTISESNIFKLIVNYDKNMAIMR